MTIKLGEKEKNGLFCFTREQPTHSGKKHF